MTCPIVPSNFLWVVLEGARDLLAEALATDTSGITVLWIWVPEEAPLGPFLLLRARW